jgi:UDP-N-acetylglucosamine 2-epimerase (non-hydrolysing)
MVDAGSVAVVLGTRPEIIKLARIIELLGDRGRTIFSGQHFDAGLSSDFFGEFGLAPPDAALGVGGNSRAIQIADTVTGLEHAFLERRPAAVIVQGDTNTALGGALAANAAGVFLVHVEAGLRSYDRAMPEEHNRVVVDHLADLCLAPTETAAANLVGEGIGGDRVRVTGNTVIDMVVRLLPPPAERAQLLAGLGLTRSRFLLSTFHRPENVDDAVRLEALLRQLGGLPMPVVLPLHPRTRARVRSFGLEPLLADITVVDPIGYRSFLSLAAESACLVSDSGGIQEEASFVKRPVVVVRRSTERPEVLGTFAQLVGVDGIAAAARPLLDDPDEVHRRLAALPCPYGEGNASEASVGHIVAALDLERLHPTV